MHNTFGCTFVSSFCQSCYFARYLCIRQLKANIWEVKDDQRSMLGTSYLHEKRLILQERIWATTWFYASVLSRGTIALNWASEKYCAAAQLSAIVLCRGIIANSKAKTHSIEKIRVKRGKIRGSWYSSLLGHSWGLVWVLGHGSWWRLSWGLKFWRDLGFTSWFFFSILLSLLLFNVYDYYCIFSFGFIGHE